jgi:PAS domain-containing protein
MDAFTVATVLIYLLIASSLGSGFLNFYLGWTVPLEILSPLLLWLASVFYVTLSLPLIKMAFGCSSVSSSDHVLHPFFPSMECWGVTHIGYVVLSLITLALFFRLALAVASFAFDARVPSKSQPGDNPVTARVHNRAEAGLLVAKTILLILFVAGHSASWRLPLAVLLVATGVASAVYLLRWLPWWEDLAMSLAVAQSGILAWTGLVAGFMALVDDSEGTAMLYFVFLVPVVFASFLLVRWRCTAVALLTETDCTAPHLVIARVRALVRAHYQYLRLFGDVYIENSPEVAERSRELASHVEDTIAMGIRRFPESADVRLFAALYLTSVAHNRVLGFRELQATEGLRLSYDQRFRAACLRRDLEAAAALSQSGEVARYLEFKARRDAVELAVASAMRLLIEFWTELLRDAPDIDLLASVGHRARSELTVVQAHYDRLLQLNPASVPILRQYGVVQLEALADVARAASLFEQADQVELSKKQSLLECDYSAFLNIVPGASLDIFDEVNGVANVSVAEESMGVIEAGNPAFHKMYGYTDLVGKSFNVLLPTPIREQHDRYVRDYLRTKKSWFLGQIRLVMGLHASGHLQAFTMYVRWADEAMGRMVAVMQMLNNTHEVCAFFDEQDRLLHATANLHSIFGFSRRDILGRKLLLADVIPALRSDDEDNDHARAQLLSPRGLQCEAAHDLTQQRFRVHAHVAVHHAYEDRYSVLRCHVTQLQSEDDDAHFDESDRESLLGDLAEGRAMAAVAESLRSPVPALDLSAATATASPRVVPSPRPTNPELCGPILAKSAPAPAPALPLGADAADETASAASSSRSAASSARSLSPWARGKTDNQPRTAEPVEGRSSAVETGRASGASRASSSLRRNQNHRRLQKAIAYDNARSLKQLSLLRIFSVVMVAVILLLAVTGAVVTSDSVARSELLIHNVYRSSLRYSMLVDIMLHFRTFQRFVRFRATLLPVVVELVRSYPSLLFLYIYDILLSLPPRSTTSPRCTTPTTGTTSPTGTRSAPSTSSTSSTSSRRSSTRRPPPTPSSSSSATAPRSTWSSCSPTRPARTSRSCRCAWPPATCPPSRAPASR